MIKRQRRQIVFMLFFVFLFSCLAGCGSGNNDVTPSPAVTLEPIAQMGQTVFSENCAICHTVIPDTVLRGPSLYGIATTGGRRVANQDARTYLYNSIMQPSDYLVEGYDDLMPKTLAKDLTGEELDAVVAYLLTFK